MWLDFIDVHESLVVVNLERAIFIEEYDSPSRPNSEYTKIYFACDRSVIVQFNTSKLRDIIKAVKGVHLLLGEETVRAEEGDM